MPWSKPCGSLMGMTIARLFHRLDMTLESEDYILKTKSFPTPGPAMDFKVKIKGERMPADKLIPEA